VASNEQTKEMRSYGIVKTVVVSLKIMFKACDSKELMMFGAGLLAAAVPSAILYLQKEFFARVEQYLAQPSQVFIVGIMLLLAGWALLEIVQCVSDLFGVAAERRIGAKINKFVLNKLLAKMAAIRYEYMDTPDVYNRLQWVSNELPNRISQVVNDSMSFCYRVVQVFAMLSLVLTQDWRIALIVILGAIPYFLLVRMQLNEEYQRAQSEAPILRQEGYVFSLFMRRDSIREMRVGQYADYLLKKWKDLCVKVRSHRYIRKYFFLNLLSSVIGYVSIGIALGFVCARILDPASGTSVDAFVLVYGIAASLQMRVTSFLSEVMSMAATGRYLRDYDDLSAYAEELLLGENEIIPQKADIIFENVSFAYPNTDRLVLRDINVKIRQGEKIAIVGENGSGKTTFFLLLAGLYRPQKGKIFFAGKNLEDNLGLMRRATSFVFQDFGRYQLTVADNIRIGNLYRELSDADIELAAKLSGADEFIQKLEQKYQTFLGNLEEGRTDLSGGQWQKLAFARAIAKPEARVMMLDEQTAALDPISEAKFYQEFKELTGDRIAIMISHRLGATKLADRIFVFDKGQIVEEGTHEELMKRRGLYYEMYQAQAQWYM